MKFRVYSRKPCGFCQRAIALLTSRKEDFEVIELSGNNAAVQALKNRTNLQTVPQIFEMKDGKEVRLIGGFDCLKKMFDEEKLNLRDVVTEESNLCELNKGESIQTLH